MSLNWSVLNWESHFPILYEDSKMFKYSNNQNHFIVLKSENITSLLCFKDDTFLTPIHTYCLKGSKILDVFVVKTLLFMMDEDRIVHELSVQQETLDDGFCFGESDSPENSSETKIWKSVQKIEGALSVTGIEDGICIIKSMGYRLFLEMYKYDNKNFILLNSKEICKCEETNEKLYFQTLKGTSREIFKITHKDFGSLCKEVVIFQTPHGFLSCVPVLKNFNLEPTKLHYEKNLKIVNIFSTQSSELFIVYSNGKLVILYSNSYKIEKAQFYLPKDVLTISDFQMCDNNEQIFVWSDGFDIHFSKIQNRTDLLNLKITKKLKYICNMIPINNFILAINFYGGFYKLDIGETKNLQILPKSSQEILAEINSLGINIDKINENIKKNANMFYALCSSKIENIGNYFKITLENDSIIIENNSVRNFSKEYWKLKFEMKKGQKNIVKFKHFDYDFCISSSIEIDIKFLGSSFENVDVSLIGELQPDLNFLYIHLPKLELQRHTSSLSEKLNKMLEEQCKVE